MPSQELVSKSRELHEKLYPMIERGVGGSDASALYDDLGDLVEEAEKIAEAIESGVPAPSVLEAATGLATSYAQLWKTILANYPRQARKWSGSMLREVMHLAADLVRDLASQVETRGFADQADA